MSVCLVGFNLKGVLAKSLANDLLMMGDSPFLRVWAYIFWLITCSLFRHKWELLATDWLRLVEECLHFEGQKLSPGWPRMWENLY